MLPFTREELAAAVDDGRVTGRRHPTLPYTIYNYTPQVQFSNHWDEITLTCRGLILDDDFNIVARPWKKFFNLGQVNLPIQLTDPVEVMDKADGSLGILYPKFSYQEGGYGPEGPQKSVMAIATRGSFASDQAFMATKIWEEKYAELHDQEAFGGGNYTYLFEIIYPSNRIVLDYGDMSDLILLGCVEVGHGYYFGPREAAAFLDWSGPVVETMEYKTISDAMRGMDRPNAEGFVIRSHNFLVKMKQPDYLDLHRLVTNMTPKTIWEKLRDGRTVENICADLPDEFHSMVKNFAEPILETFEKRSREIVDGYWVNLLTLGYSHATPPPRKMFAQAIQKNPDKGYYFAMLDGRDITEMLWKEIKPRETSMGEIKDSLNV